LYDTVKRKESSLNCSSEGGAEFSRIGGKKKNGSKARFDAEGRRLTSEVSQSWERKGGKKSGISPVWREKGKRIRDSFQYESLKRRRQKFTPCPARKGGRKKEVVSLKNRKGKMEPSPGKGGIDWGLIEEKKGKIRFLIEEANFTKGGDGNAFWGEEQGASSSSMKEGVFSVLWEKRGGELF